jgi:sugar-phosphatase
LQSLPPDRWAVVTSAPRALAVRRLDAAGLPVPPVLVTAEDVERGKPSPDGFLMAAGALGFAAGDCLIWEDAPAGIAAAEAAGGTVIVVGATHATPMKTPHPVITGYEDLTVTVVDTGDLTLIGELDQGEARLPH